MRVGVLTTGRQDWGILRSTCHALARDPAFQLVLIAGGMHLAARFGRTVTMLEEDGLPISEALSWIPDGAPVSAADESAEALRVLAAAFRRQRPDALLLVGDRYETMAAAMAATLERIPIAHLHGGEETEGAFDNALRHAITKLAHLHLTSHETHAARVRALGEDARAVHVVGAPGLDNARRTDLPDRAALEGTLGLALRAPVVLVTLHPATLGDDPAREAAAVTAAMDRVPATYVITLPNSDPGSAATRAVLVAAVAGRADRVAVDALGERRYWAMLGHADAMLGNSSSALIEAPVFGLPAVNVGIRQRGRLRGANLIDAPPDAEAIAIALRRALSPAFRAGLAGTTSPYGDGRSAARIVEILRAWTPPHPPTKPAIPVSA